MIISYCQGFTFRRQDRLMGNKPGRETEPLRQGGEFVTPQGHSRVVNRI